MKAMVLCAGLGTRLGDLTRETPKPMLFLKSQPILAYILGNLKRHGFDEIVINLHFRPEMIREYFGDGTAGGIRITYSLEPELLGTAGGVKKVETFFRDTPHFLVHYGDIVTDQDFTAMLQFHRERGALATLLLHERIKSNSLVTLDEEGRIISFLERPTEAERGSHASLWVNSGVCICAPEILDALPPGRPCDWPREIFPELVGTRRLFGFPLSGYRCAVDSAARLAEAEAAVSEGRCRLGALEAWSSQQKYTL